MVAVVGFLTFYAVVGNCLHFKKSWQLLWNHWCCRIVMFILGIEVKYDDDIPKTGLIAANHMGYLDIFALGAIAPFAFVTSVDMSSKGFAGFVIRASGSVPVERRGVMQAKDDANSLGKVCREFPLVVFPEATSNKMGNMTEFKSSLFQVAVDNGLPVMPAAISYSNPGMCFVKGMNLFKHLGRHRGEIYVNFLPGIYGNDRKSFCRLAQGSIRNSLNCELFKFN